MYPGMNTKEPDYAVGERELCMPVRLCRTSQAVDSVVSLRLEVSRAEHSPNDPSFQSVAVSAEHRSTKKASMHGKHIVALLSRLTSHEREKHLSGSDESRHRCGFGAGRRRRLGVEQPLTDSRFICRPPNHILSFNILPQENPSTPSPDSIP